MLEEYYFLFMVAAIRLWLSALKAEIGLVRHEVTTLELVRFW
ncbi:MAG TPA: hypothetical protein V6D48_22355 [Oculatellaceae cyanobacterium]